MARGRYKSSSRYSGRRRAGYSSWGLERAKQHIREAEELSQELGGTDKDVKEYFFSLNSAQLAHVLQLYGQQHGEKAKEYAEETIAKWRTGRVKMAGQTAARLFKLLPPLMPLAKKYELTESLWRHVGPASKRRLRVGLDADLEVAVGKVREHIGGVVSGYQIPEPLTRRFEWISSGDVGVKQQLLNHLQDLEKRLVVEAARQQLPVMLEHLKRDQQQHTSRMTQVLKVGKHELEVLLDRNAQGAELEEWRPLQSTSYRAGSGNSTWVLWVIGIVAIVAFLVLRK